MQRILAVHNGQRTQGASVSPDVIFVNRLSEEHCELTYDLSQFDAVQLSLGDIDTQSVELKQIGNSWWTVFNTRNFSKSIKYRHPKDPDVDYSAENGGFSLDTKENAESFSRAFTRAAILCGGKPSSF